MPPRRPDTPSHRLPALVLLVIISGFYLLSSMVAGIWMLAAMIVAVRQALDYTSTGRVLGVFLIDWISQFFLLYMLAVPGSLSVLTQDPMAWRIPIPPNTYRTVHPDEELLVFCLRAQVACATVTASDCEGKS
jgi:energy-coupling factor transporter transmembrane protein EcfT